MQLINRARAAAPAALLITTLLVPTGVFAHEHRDVENGKYTFVVGWDSEPPYLGQANAATVRISLAATDPAQPVEGAEQTLSVQVHQGDMIMQLPLRAIDGKPGNYAADIIPARVGDAQWMLRGTVNGDSIDEMFDTANGKFDAIKPPVTADSPIARDGAMSSMNSAADAGRLNASLDVLDHSGLHDLDMGLQTGNMPEGAVARVAEADLAIGTTIWPMSVQGTAAQLSAQLGLLHKALESGDMGAAIQPGHQAHELSHQFSTEVRTWLAEQAIAPAAGTAATMSDTDMHGTDVGMAAHQDPDLSH